MKNPIDPHTKPGSLQNPRKQGTHGHGQESRKVTVRLPLTTHQKLSKLVVKWDTSKSIIIRTAIDQFIDQQESKND
jgi:hypothetical protein